MKVAFGKILNNGALASRGELRSPANVAFGTVLPGGANGMIRGFPRRAEDICPYGSGVVFAPVGEAISLPQALPVGAMQRNGMLGCWAVTVSDCEIVIDLFGYVKERWNG